MQKVDLNMLVQYQILEKGAKLSYQMIAKLPYLTLLFKSVFTKEKNILPDFESLCEANISEVAFSEERVKKKLLNVNPYKSPGEDNLHPRILKELSVNLSLPLSVLYNEPSKPQRRLHDWKDAMITPL